MSDRPIAIIAPGHPSVTRSGPVMAAHALHSGLQALGQASIFVAVGQPGEADRLVLAEQDEVWLPHPAAARDPFYHLAAPDFWPRLRDILAARRARHVHVQHFPALGLGALRAMAAENLPFSVSLMDFSAICRADGQMVTPVDGRLCAEATPAACVTCFPNHTQAQFQLRQALAQAALRPAAALIVPNDLVARRLAAWGLDPSRLSVMPPGVLAVAASRRRRVDTGFWQFGVFGGLTHAAGALLAQACQTLASQGGAGRFSVGLHGAVRPAPQDWFRELGPYANAHVQALMTRFDYIVVPGSVWRNSPMVMTEAGAAGVPVIAAAIGNGLSQIEDGVTGLHFKPGDPADLARVMELAMDNALHARFTPAQVPDVVSMAVDFCRVTGLDRIAAS